MSDALEFYLSQMQKEHSSLPWVAHLQKKSVNELRYFGFPNRSHEDWKYTPLESLLQNYFPKSKQPKFKSFVASKLPEARQIVLGNGYIEGLEKLTEHLAPGVLIAPLSSALSTHEDKIKPYLDTILIHQHGFHSLNTALFNQGLFIYIPKGIKLEQTIVPSHWQDEPQALYIRHLIVMEEDTKATIIEEYRGVEGCAYFTNSIAEVSLAKNANLTYYKIQRESKEAFHIGELAIKQYQASSFSHHSLSFGGKLVRSDIHLDLAQEKACCSLNGIYMTDEGQHIDHHTSIHHLVPNCISEQNYKGILAGKSRAVFNGKVKVAKDAQHTQAKQQNKNLLLSSEAEIDTKPQLEIFANDVICTHGATVGQLDEEALFYLATRGIEKEEANRYLIQAFADENLRIIPDKAMAAWIASLLDQQLG